MTEPGRAHRTLEQEKAAIVSGLKKSRKKLESVVRDKEREIGSFGRWWGMVGGLMLIPGCFLLLILGCFAPGHIKTSLGPDIGFGHVFIILIAAIPMTIASMNPKGWTRGIMVCLFPAAWLFSFLLCKDEIPAAFIGLLAYPVIIVIAIGPVASSVVRTKFPGSRFAIIFGLVTGILWLAFIVFAAFFLLKNSHDRLLKSLVLILILFPLWGCAVIAMLNGIRNMRPKNIRFRRSAIVVGAFKTRNRARFAVYYGMSPIPLLLFLPPIILLYENSPYFYDWDLRGQFFHTWGLAWIIAGVLLTAGTVMSHFLLRIAHAAWKKQALQELQRLDTDISED
jgi:hypothetical protein